MTDSFFSRMQTIFHLGQTINPDANPNHLIALSLHLGKLFQTDDRDQDLIVKDYLNRVVLKEGLRDEGCELAAPVAQEFNSSPLSQEALGDEEISPSRQRRKPKAKVTVDADQGSSSDPVKKSSGKQPTGTTYEKSQLQKDIENALPALSVNQLDKIGRIRQIFDSCKDTVFKLLLKEKRYALNYFTDPDRILATIVKLIYREVPVNKVITALTKERCINRTFVEDAINRSEGELHTSENFLKLSKKQIEAFKASFLQFSTKLKEAGIA